MAPLQVRDVLHHLEAKQDHLVRELRALRTRAVDEEARDALAYLADTVDKLRAEIVTYAAGAPRSDADTWLKPAPDLRRLDEVLRHLPVSINLDSVEALAIDMGRALHEVYAPLSQAQAPEHLAETFESLLAKLDHELHRAASGLSRTRS